jgi:transposase
MPVYPVSGGSARCAASGCRCHDRVRAYPSDTTDAQWAVLEPRAKEVMAGLVKAKGRPMDHDLRAVVDAVFYVVKNGVQWRALPVDFPLIGRRCGSSSTGEMPGACPRRWSAGCVVRCASARAEPPSRPR